MDKLPKLTSLYKNQCSVSQAGQEQNANVQGGHFSDFNTNIVFLKGPFFSGIV